MVQTARSELLCDVLFLLTLTTASVFSYVGDLGFYNDTGRS